MQVCLQTLGITKKLKYKKKETVGQLSRKTVQTNGGKKTFLRYSFQILYTSLNF
jgi:hypothetical protein